MCIQDWQLGRFIRSSFSVTGDAGTTAQIVKASRQRVAILFVADPAFIGTPGLFYIKVNGAMVGSMGIFPVPIYFAMNTHGDLPTKEFTLTAQGTPAIMSITEFFLPEDVLDKFGANFRLGSNA
jgi:hypothetical protein